MPSKFKRNGKWTGQWHGQVKFRGRRMRSPLLSSREEALAWEVDAKRLLRQGLSIEAPKKTVMVSLLDWANKYLDYCFKYSGKTFSEKKKVMHRLKQKFGPDVPVGSITPGMALEHLQDQFQKRSGYAANKERKNLSAAWQWGAEFLDGFPGTENPFRKRKATTFPVEPQERYIPPEGDFWKVVDLARGQAKVLLLAMFYTGARIGELRRLTWQDVDFAGGRIRLKTRKRQSRSLESDWLPMVDNLYETLLKHRQEAVNEYVFIQHGGRNDCKAFTENTIRGFLRELCEQAEVQPFGFHAVRHLTASGLAMQGVPNKVIQQVLRHQKSSTTELYMHGAGDLKPYLSLLHGGKSKERTNGRSNDQKNAGLRTGTSQPC